MHEEVLQRLVQRIEQGSKTLASALLYAAEYDRLHNTNLAKQLQSRFVREQEETQLPRPRKRRKQQ